MKMRSILALCLVFLFAASLVGCPAPDNPDGPGGFTGTTYTVSYYYDYDRDGVALGNPDERDTVAEGARAVMLSLAPTEQYELEGWYRINPDGTAGVKWDVNDPVTEDIGLIANWRVRDYYVHYYVGGRELWMDTIPYGAITDDPYASSPELCVGIDEWKAELDAGRAFVGWYTLDGVRWDFDNMTVRSELTLQARFE